MDRWTPKNMNSTPWSIGIRWIDNNKWRLTKNCFHKASFISKKLKWFENLPETDAPEHMLDTWSRRPDQTCEPTRDISTWRGSSVSLNSVCTSWEALEWQSHVPPSLWSVSFHGFQVGFPIFSYHQSLDSYENSKCLMRDSRFVSYQYFT